MFADTSQIVPILDAQGLRYHRPEGLHRVPHVMDTVLAPVHTPRGPHPSGIIQLEIDTGVSNRTSCSGISRSSSTSSSTSSSRSSSSSNSSSGSSSRRSRKLNKPGLAKSWLDKSLDEANDRLKTKVYEMMGE